MYGMILYDQHKESYFRSENDFIRVVQSVVTELPNVTDVRFGQGGCICYDDWDDDGTPDPPHSGLPIGVMTTVLSAYSNTLIRLDASYGVHCVDVKNEKECNRFIFAFKKAKNLLYWTFPRYFDGPYEMEIMKIVKSKTKKIKKNVVSARWYREWWGWMTITWTKNWQLPNHKEEEKINHVTFISTLTYTQRHTSISSTFPYISVLSHSPLDRRLPLWTLTPISRTFINKDLTVKSKLKIH